jgi:CubicO group peptidase (beta-lactamase class C family)
LYYDKVWEQGDLSGGFLWQKEIKLWKYRGFAKENEQVPIDKIFLHVASVSKTLTAMAIWNW